VWKGENVESLLSRGLVGGRKLFGILDLSPIVEVEKVDRLLSSVVEEVAKVELVESLLSRVLV
jgi:hypothetical protein